MRENFLGAIENFLWQAGQARHLDAVTLVRAAGNHFAQENDLVVPFAHRHIEIADAFAVLGQFGQLVVVRGEKGAGLILSWRNSATLHAIDSPSNVDVPRPISSRTTSERSVALWMMLAVSFISTMKVD